MMMKTGKYINLGVYENIKIGYGTVDYKNLKSIYIKLNAWVLPQSIEDFSEYVFKTKKKIKDQIYNKENIFFKRESIIDFDIKTKGLKKDKKSFMNLEITLFNKDCFDLKDKEIKKYIKILTNEIIINELMNDNVFTFHLKK